MPDLQLSQIKPDFDYFKAAIRTYLSQSTTWGNIVDSPVADSVIDVLASIATMDSLKILRAAQETNIKTALAPSTVYALAAEQGIRLSRKTPGKCQATLYNNGTEIVTITPYSTFEYAGIFFFNRNVITVAPGLSLAVELYEGQVITNATYGLGEDHASFVTKESGFVVSDTDVSVYINGSPISRITDPIWITGSTPAFQDRTLPDGRALVQFGTDTIGTKPGVNDVVNIIYVVTKGKDGNSLDVMGKAITCASNASITGVINTTLSGGDTHTSALKLKNLPVPTFGSLSTAVSKSQYIATILSYPGIVDATAISQREANPYALEWMNLVKVVLLTGSTWTPTQKAAFKSYIEDRCGYTTRIELAEPEQLLVNVAINAYCYAWANLSQVKSDIEAAIETLLEARPGIIGYDVYRSDLVAAITNSNSGIQYIDLVNPSFDVIVTNKSMDAPSYAVSAGTGTLAAGTYSYAVVADVGLGDSPPTNYATVTVLANSSSVVLAWTPVPGAQGYKVYGRSSLFGVGLLTTTGPTITSFTDFGTDPIGVAPPAQSELPIKYPKLGSMNVTVNYSRRSR